MTTQSALSLKAAYPALAAAVDQSAEVIEIELADRTLKYGLLAQYSSSVLARTVARECVSMIQLSLITGDLTTFQNFLKWEVEAVLHNNNFHKAQYDQAFISLAQTIMLEYLDPSLTEDIKSFSEQLRVMFDQIWKDAELQWHGK
ncbi:MAG: hypothetical protein WCS37_04080 [Chloroflexota bacterium]|nr:hypothetical protein [Chloroflexota bacterium]